jgi:hypothetical protein
MTKAEQETPGTGLEKNIGRFNSYAEVTFRWISKLTASLNTGRFTHALTANYHSGYTDQVYNEDDSVVREVLARRHAGRLRGIQAPRLVVHHLRLADQGATGQADSR